MALGKPIIAALVLGNLERRSEQPQDFVAQRVALVEEAAELRFLWAQWCGEWLGSFPIDVFTDIEGSVDFENRTRG